MKRVMLGIAAGLFLTGVGSVFEAVAGPRNYDLGILMYQPHPFAGPVAPTAWPLHLGPAPASNALPPPVRKRPTAAMPAMSRFILAPLGACLARLFVARLVYSSSR